MLKGTFVALEPGQYGFEHLSESMTKPERTRHVWRVNNVGNGRGSMGYATADNAIGKEATCSDSIVNVYLGSGSYITGTLDNGGKAVIVEITPVHPPRARKNVGLRWHHDGYRGFWQKYLKSQGWVRA